jgi:hypothetical protein
VVLFLVADINLFRRYPLDDAFTLVVNGLFLFTIVFYAFPLKFIAGSVLAVFLPGDQSVVQSPEQLRNLFMIYGLGWSMIFFCIALLYLHAARERDELGLSEIETYDAVSDGFYYLCFVVGGMMSVAFADFNIGVEVGLPAITYCLIGILVVPMMWVRRHNRPDSLDAALPPLATSRDLVPDIPDD